MSLSTDVKEINFALFLDELFGEDVTQGATTRAVRRDRARALILRMKAADRLVGKKQTLGEAFAAVYGEPLEFPYRHEPGDCA